MSSHLERKSRYSGVSLLDRIREALGTDTPELSELDEFSYSWRAGYETFEVRREGSGTVTYRGVYHPDEGMCVGNPCHYCGHAYYEHTAEDFA